MKAFKGSEAGQKGIEIPAFRVSKKSVPFFDKLQRQISISSSFLIVHIYQFKTNPNLSYLGARYADVYNQVFSHPHQTDITSKHQKETRSTESQPQYLKI